MYSTESNMSKRHATMYGMHTEFVTLSSKWVLNKMRKDATLKWNNRSPFCLEALSFYCRKDRLIFIYFFLSYKFKNALVAHRNGSWKDFPIMKESAPSMGNYF